MKEIKIIVAHPGKQHSFRVAKALNEAGLLDKYITTVYNKQGSVTALLGKLAGGKLRNKISNRRTNDIDDTQVVQICEVRGLIGLFLTKIPYLHKRWPWWNAYLNDCYGRKVAKYAIKHNVDAVIGYDGNSTVLFEILKEKAPQITRILDVSIINRKFMRDQFDKDIEVFGCDEIKKEYPLIWVDKYLNKYIREVELTNYFIGASEIVKRSIVYCGGEEECIYRVPYGVDVEKFSFSEESENKEDKLNIIYIGSVLYRKGAHHLMKVVSEYFTNKVQLTMLGHFETDTEMYKKYSKMENISLVGFVTRDKLVDTMKKADVLVFPTLAEGFSMSVLEALSCGIPCCVSENAGANDVIKNEYNGMVFPVHDEDALKAVIDWCCAERKKLKEMRINARKTAEEYTWNHFYENYVNAVKDILRREEKMQ